MKVLGLFLTLILLCITDAKIGSAHEGEMDEMQVEHMIAAFAKQNDLQVMMDVRVKARISLMGIEPECDLYTVSGRITNL